MHQVLISWASMCFLLQHSLTTFMCHAASQTVWIPEYRGKIFTALRKVLCNNRRNSENPSRPPSVYLGRHNVIHNKMDQAFPLRFCILQKLDCGKGWERDYTRPSSTYWSGNKASRLSAPLCLPNRPTCCLATHLAFIIGSGSPVSVYLGTKWFGVRMIIALEIFWDNLLICT